VTPRQSSAQLTLLVFLEDQEPYQVETRLVDHNSWDITRARHKWPTGADAPMTWMGFIAWTASRRAGAIPRELTWELFTERCLAVETVGSDDEDEDEGVGVGPTHGAPGPD
jgi:hypothetical protein